VEARKRGFKESALNFPNGGTPHRQVIASRGNSHNIMELFLSEGSQVPSGLESLGRELLAIVEQLDESGAVLDALEHFGVPVHLYEVRSAVFCCVTPHLL
jgi:hypothetical protein